MTILHTKKIWQGKLMNQRRENPSDSRSNLTESSHQSVIIWWVPKSTRLTTDSFSKRGSDLFVMCHILVLSVLPEVGPSCQDDFTKNWRSEALQMRQANSGTSRTWQNSPLLRQWKGRTKYWCFQTKVHPIASPKNVMLSSPQVSINLKKEMNPFPGQIMTRFFREKLPNGGPISCGQWKATPPWTSNLIRVSIR